MRNLFTFALKPAISCILLHFKLAHVNFDLIGRQSYDRRYIWLAAEVLIRAASAVHAAVAEDRPSLRHAG
jgi:hypothetical protein